RHTMLPERWVETLEEQLNTARLTWLQALRDPQFAVALPDAIARKAPNAGRQFGWYWVFPAARVYHELRTNTVRRHHLHQTGVQRSVAMSVRASGIHK